MKLVAAVVTFALAAAGVARADALVGETTRAQTEPAAIPAPNAVREAYRRPDAIPFPPDDPYTPEKAWLGRLLYNDTRLSSSNTLACGSCHNPGFIYGNGLALGVGSDMKPLGRRSPSIINSAWGELFMWDGRADSLESQALAPIVTANEMNLPLDRLVSVLAGMPEYQKLFADAFPRQSITPVAVAQAIATYERTIVSAIAPFDAWIEGDDQAIPAAAKRGFDLFNGKAHCASCHTGWLFTDAGFHDIGLPGGDQGRGRLLPEIIKMQHAFKTPSLREVARRGPYMHNGSLPTLEAVVAHYDRGGMHRPSQSELIEPLGLSSDERADIVAFLGTLTSSVEPDFIPSLPR